MDLLTLIEKYWTAIVAFTGIIISYTNLKSQNAEQEKRIVHLETKTDMSAENQILLKVQLTEIQNDIRWIKLSLKNDK